MRIQTRKQAIAAGVKTYLGSPCKRGHDGLRVTSSGDCVECGRERLRARYWASPEEARARVSEYSKRPEVAERRRAQSKTERGRQRNRESVQRYRQTPVGRLDHRVRSRIRAGLIGARCGSGWMNILGYTVGELKTHLERQFLPGMSWENMGKWHVDHIVPLKSFNYSTIHDADFRAAWSLTNLRPLWAADNMKKHARRENLL